MVGKAPRMHKGYPGVALGPSNYSSETIACSTISRVGIADTGETNGPKHFDGRPIVDKNNQMKLLQTNLFAGG